MTRKLFKSADKGKKTLATEDAEAAEEAEVIASVSPGVLCVVKFLVARNLWPVKLLQPCFT